MTVDGQTLLLNHDYTPVPRVGVRPVRDSMNVVYGGMLDSTAHITSEQASGKLVVLTAPANTGRGGRGGGGRGNTAPPPELMGADAIAVIVGDSLPVQAPARGILPDDADRLAAGPVR